MKKNTKLIIMVFVFLVIGIAIPSKKIVFAESITNKLGTYTYSTTDDGTDGPDVKSIRFHITFYGDPGEPTLCGATLDQFSHKNEKHKWNEIEIDGEYYAVIAGATHYMLKQPDTAQNYRWFWSTKFDHIHYFKTDTNMDPKDCEKIEFRFEDQNFDSNVYKGVILDTGGALMFPQDDEYDGFEPDINILDFYYEDSENGNQPPEADEVNGKIIIVTNDGTFSSSSTSKTAEQDKIGLVEFILDAFTKYINLPLGDKIKKILYSRKDL